MTTTATATTTTTTTNHDNKVKSIEQTVAKSNVRTNIHRQIEEYLYSLETPLESINLATLAAKEWLFEYGLLNCLNHSLILPQAPEVNFVSAEKDKATAMASFVNMPQNATVLKGQFSDIFNSPWKTSKAGFSYLTDDEKDRTEKASKQYHVVWADYCCYATTELLKDFKYVVENNISQGMVYLTFCLSKRRGADKKSLKDLKKYSNSTSIEDVTADAIKTFAKSIKGKRVKKIFEVVYGGGSTSGTSMVTVGYGVNLPKDSVTPIMFDDSEWKSSEDRARRHQVVHTRLKNFGGWTVKSSGRKKSTYKSKANPELIAKRLKNKENQKKWEKVKKKILVRANRGWESDKIYADLEDILAPMGKTKQSVSSVLAWRSPKLAKKKVK